MASRKQKEEQYHTGLAYEIFKQFGRGSGGIDFGLKSIRAIRDTIAGGLSRDGRVSIPHFGTFYTVTLDPKTGEVGGNQFYSPSHKVVRFKPSPHLKAMMNRSEDAS